jgi:MFS family permease
MLVCGLTSDITMMAAGRFVAGLAAGFGVFSIFLIVFDATEPERRSAAGSLVWSGIGVAIVASGLASGLILDGSGWRLSFVVPAVLSLAVAVFIPRTISAARGQPKAADVSPSRLAELTSARWVCLYRRVLLRRFRPHRRMMMSDLPNAVFFDHDETKACRDNNRLAVRRRS